MQAAYRGDDLPATQFTGLFRGSGRQFTVQPAFQPFSGGQSGQRRNQSNHPDLSTPLSTSIYLLVMTDNK